MIGVCYEEGHGVDCDIEKAVEWYKKAADQGYKASQVSLSRLEFLKEWRLNHLDECVESK